MVGAGCSGGDDTSEASSGSSGDTSTTDATTGAGGSSTSTTTGAGGGNTSTTTGAGGNADPCANGVKDGAESDVDCGGGTCGACADGATCNGPADCVSGSCNNGVCGGMAAACDNNKQDGSETGIDCGGACPPCATTSCEGGGPGTGNDCGPNQKDCCETVLVPGGTFNRGNDPQFPATLSSYYLETFEVTVGRFRNFVNSGHGTQQNPPAPGDGAHKLIPNSGWDSAWNSKLKSTSTSFRSAITCESAYDTWTDAPGPNELKPVTCMTWFEAFAFCAWDGGRLPTEAEINYAQTGGSEQRAFPWGMGPVNSMYLVFDCNADGSASGQCAASDVPAVGSRSPLGDGKWGHTDLAGSMTEWSRDAFMNKMPQPCTDCAQLTDPVVDGIATRGGSFKSVQLFVVNTKRAWIESDFRIHASMGIRCAKDP